MHKNDRRFYVYKGRKMKFKIAANCKFTLIQFFIQQFKAI